MIGGLPPDQWSPTPAQPTTASSSSLSGLPVSSSPSQSAGEQTTTSQSTSGPPTSVAAPGSAAIQPAAQVTPALDFEDIQGDILVGLQKRAEAFFLFEIVNIAGFKKAFGQKIFRRITSMALAREREAFLGHLDESDDITLSLSGLNIGFTAAGLQKLGFKEQLEPSFSTPLENIAKLCGDGIPGKPLSEASVDFPTDNSELDGIILLTGRDPGAVEAAKNEVKELLGINVTDAWPTVPIGKTRPGAMRGHEHFGWKDGVSQPVITELTSMPSETNVSAADFVINAGSALPPWAVNGSYMVYRCLEQDVVGFEAAVVKMAADNQYQLEELGARMMGRWKSGARLVAGGHVDPGWNADEPKNNAFDYSDDNAGMGCPLGSHIRKTNPRKGNMTRIMRRGIPYGSELGDDPNGTRGLNFVCYQSSLTNQFEFIQQSWVNNSGFQTGIDPIIGRDLNSPAQSFSDNMTGVAAKVMPLPRCFVTGRAAAYFFMPSMSTLALIPWQP